MENKSSTDMYKHDCDPDITKDSSFINLISNFERSGVAGRHVIFVLGPMGAGKSTYIKQTLLTDNHYKGYIYVDTDEIMATIDGFQMSQVDHYYLKARQISYALTDWVLEKSYSFIAEGTCVEWEELWNFMKRLKAKDYRIDMIFMETPLKVVICQASSRERKLAEEKVRSIYCSSMDGCKRLLEENKKFKVFNSLKIVR